MMVFAARIYNCIASFALCPLPRYAKKPSRSIRHARLFEPSILSVLIKSDPNNLLIAKKSGSFPKVAGVAGFEPTNDGVRGKLTFRKIAVFAHF